MTRFVPCLALLGASILGCGAAQRDATGAHVAPRPSETETRDAEVVSPPSEPGPERERPGPAQPAAHGEVCSSADHGVSRPCAEGLSCCYPCGIDGCDSVCHTAEECQMDRMRP